MFCLHTCFGIRMKKKNTFLHIHIQQYRFLSYCRSMLLFFFFLLSSHLYARHIQQYAWPNHTICMLVLETLFTKILRARSRQSRYIHFIMYYIWIVCVVYPSKLIHIESVVFPGASIYNEQKYSHSFHSARSNA